MKIAAVSIVILAHEKNQKLEKALQSSQFAHTILVVDNTQESNLNELQKKYHFEKIEHQQEISDFSQVKNLALKKVATPWVLFLDSDEVLPKDSAKEIQEIIQLDLYDAVSIKRVDYFLGKKLQHGETGNTRLIRLFKTRSGKFIRNVHEVLDFSGKIGESTFSISHFSHDSIADFLKKVMRYAYLESKNRTYSQASNILQLCVYPIAKFIVNYFFKLGFLDGYRGLVYAVVMSLHSFFVRVFYYENG